MFFLAANALGACSFEELGVMAVISCAVACVLLDNSWVIWALTSSNEAISALSYFRAFGFTQGAHKELAQSLHVQLPCLFWLLQATATAAAFFMNTALLLLSATSEGRFKAARAALCVVLGFSCCDI